MAGSAELLSFEVLRDLRVALVRFAEDAGIALQDVDFEIRRTTEWLTNEQRLYWQSEIRRWQQKLAQAKTELHRKKLQRFSDRRPDTSQEEKAVRRAEERLETAHRKLERIKRWVPELQRAVQDYRSLTRPLADVIEMQIPRDIARLDRMLAALEDYARLSAPRTPGLSETSPPGPSAGGMGRGDTPPTAPEAGTERPPEAPETEKPPGPEPGPTGGHDERQFGLE